jgi:hypothetical protein
MSAASRVGSGKITNYFRPAPIPTLEEGDLVNPFPVGPDVSEEALLKASRFAKAAKQDSRKGMKRRRYSPDQKLRVCLYIKQNNACKRELVGMKVLGEDLAASTVCTWYTEFQSDPRNKAAWTGPDDGLVWPVRRLGRPLQLPPKVLKRTQSYFATYQEQGLQLTRQLARYA